MHAETEGPPGNVQDHTRAKFPFSLYLISCVRHAFALLLIAKSLHPVLSGGVRSGPTWKEAKARFWRKRKKKKNGGEDKNSVELSVEGSFIRPLGLKGAFWGYLWRVEGEIKQPIKWENQFSLWLKDIVKIKTGDVIFFFFSPWIHQFKVVAIIFSSLRSVPGFSSQVWQHYYMSNISSSLFKSTHWKHHSEQHSPLNLTQTRALLSGVMVLSFKIMIPFTSTCFRLSFVGHHIPRFLEADWTESNTRAP